MNDAVATLNHAAAQSDRWLFLATLLVLGFGVTWLVRWLVATYANTVKEVSTVVQSNTDAVNNCSKVLTDASEAIRHCRERNPPKP